VYEYCAAALPVVATPMQETAAMGAPIRLAGTAQEFAQALREARRENEGPDGETARTERLAFARRNTWDRRFDVLQGAIASLVGDTAERAAGGLR
jgi:hypothetical protein